MFMGLFDMSFTFNIMVQQITPQVLVRRKFVDIEDWKMRYSRHGRKVRKKSEVRCPESEVWAFNSILATQVLLGV